MTAEFFNTSYLTDSYISFTLKWNPDKIFAPTGQLRQVQKNIFDFPPCGKLVISINEFVIFLKTSK